MTAGRARLTALVTFVACVVLLSMTAGGALADGDDANATVEQTAVTDALDETYTSPGVYTVDVSDIDYVAVELAGAGGGGGAYDGGDEGAAGDGGAGGAVETLLDVSTLDTLDVHVGAGGDGGDNTSVDGPDENASAGAGGTGYAVGGDGGLDVDAFGFHAAGGGGGGSTELHADGVVLAAADGGGGGGAWDAQGTLCCDDAGGGGGGAGGSGGLAGSADDETGSDTSGSDSESTDRPEHGGDGGVGNSDTEVAESGSPGGGWANSDYAVNESSHSAGGAPGGVGGAERGTAGENASVHVTAVEPAFELQSVTLPDETFHGDTVTFTVAVTNTGDVDDTQTIELDVPGLGADSTDLTIAAGETTETTLTIETTEGDADIYSATVTTPHDSTTVDLTLESQRATFVISELDGLDTATPDTPATVTATILNVGNTQDMRNVTLSIAGETIAEQSLTLNGGASNTLTLSGTVPAVDGNREYTVSTGQDAHIGTVALEADEDSDLSDDDNGDDGVGSSLIGAALAAVLVLVGVGLYLYTRNRNDNDTETDADATTDDDRDIDPDETGFEWGPPGSGDND